MREPRVFTILPGTPFLATLADALLDGTLTDGWPTGTELADATVFLPTRRAGRALAALLAERAPGRALLLPRIVPLGDGEEDAFEPGSEVLPPIPPGERRLVLARLIQRWTELFDRSVSGPGVRVAPPGTAADAVALAGDLSALMDAMAVEGVDWGALDTLVEADLSSYFERTLEFVRIAHEAWPGILAERGASDPARAHHQALLAEAARLAASPPRGPVLAAGSTGSMPATAALLGAIARLPHGAVVLPGLDTALDEEAWTAIGGRPNTLDPEAGPLWGHAQCMMRRLLAGSLEIERAAVRVLGPSFHPHHPVAARRRMSSEIMRPAASTDRWAAIPPGERWEIASAGCDALAVVEAADEREEALAVAIALRETLEEPGRTAALITPDRALARRVAAELERWGVGVEDTAGVPLADSRAGRLARLAAEAAASRFAPLPLLALLAHPDVTLGLPRPEVERAAAALEIAVGRGPAPAPDLAGVAAALVLRRGTRSRRDPIPRQALAEADWDATSDLLERLTRAFAAFRDDGTEGEQDLVALANRHGEAVRALVDDDAEREPSFGVLDGLFDELALMPPDASVRGRFGEYPAFFRALGRDRTVAPEPGAGHRRVKILGLLEARLLGVDRVVLGGLDEAIWPPAAETDAFLNRPMRLKLGLSPPERRIGQTAHDFVQALGTPDAVLTRARKRGGKPTVPSRFVERLRSFVGPEVWRDVLGRGERFRRLGALLDAKRPTAPAARPAPRPGPERFPRRLSVTEVETLVRDPYAIHARHVLRLSPLDPIGALPTLAERGTIIHGVLAEFAAAWPGALGRGAEGDLLQRGADAFAPLAVAYPELHALWWPDFQRAVPRLLDWEATRRAAFGAGRFLERYGEIALPLAEGDALTVRGVADRVEFDGAGGAAIIDFKTGTPPSSKVVTLGFSPQLTLEAAILLAGGFRDVPASADAPALHFVKIGGRGRVTDVPFKVSDGRSVSAIVRAHLEGVTALARRFAVDGEGYLSRPFPQYTASFSPYDHLARVAEWSLAGAGEP